MSLAINNNLMAANTATNLTSHYGRLATSIQRLSSGLRINSAADDAAGLAIRELMRADITALNQGVRNANDAISMLQVADGALAIIDEKLIRMKELAEQAATGTYDSTQRMMIDSEFQAMGAEIDRIANATDFNGIKLLDGSLSGAHNGSGMKSTGKMKIHFGSGNDSAEDYYYVEIGDCSRTGLGLGKKMEFPAAPPGVAWINEAQIDYAGRHIILDIPAATAGRGDAAFVKGIDYYALPSGLENITITSNGTKYGPPHKPHVCLFLKNGMQLTGPKLGYDAKWSPVIDSNGNTTPKELSTASWWNSQSADTIIQTGKAAGVFDNNASYSWWGNSTSFAQPGNTQSWPNSNPPLEITCTTGINEIGATKVGKAGRTWPETYELNTIPDDLVFFIGGHDNPDDGCNTYRLQITAVITDEFLAKLKQWRGDGTEDAPVKMVTIETQDKAQQALVTIDDAIVKKDKIRAHLGALQNRLENTVSNLTIQAENLQAAESRISDVDVATEMTNFVRNQILTQSAVAMLSQANSMPQMAMQLIGG